MDFGALSPEVNSGRMYAGPGSGPMSAAAAAWTRLATELSSTARGYGSVIAGLTGAGWSGPAAESMAAAAAPFTAWLAATAARAEQAAVRVAAAASAFEEARAAVVPPAVIVANRGRLTSLVAANLLGQNSAAIAATEAEYAGMWAQDAAVMYGYAGRSAAATAALAASPFAEPPPTTNPAGQAGQAGAVAAAGAGSTHSQLSQLISAIPQALHGIASTTGSSALPAGLVGSLQGTQVPSLTQVVSYAQLLSRSIVPFNDAIKTLLYAMGQFARNVTIGSDIAAAGGVTGLSSGTEALTAAAGVGGTGSAATTMSAGVGNARLVGKLAVPPGWVQAAPAAKMAAALSDTSLAAAPAVAADAPAGVFADMTLAGMAGRAITGGTARERPISVASAMNGHAQGRLERMVTDLAGTHEVQHWHVDASRLDSLLDELSEQPGVHAVHVNDDGGGSQSELKLPRQPG